MGQQTASAAAVTVAVAVAAARPGHRRRRWFLDLARLREDLAPPLPTAPPTSTVTPAMPPPSPASAASPPPWEEVELPALAGSSTIPTPSVSLQNAVQGSFAEKLELFLHWVMGSTGAYAAFVADEEGLPLSNRHTTEDLIAVCAVLDKTAREPTPPSSTTATTSTSSSIRPSTTPSAARPAMAAVESTAARFFAAVAAWESGDDDRAMALLDGLVDASDDIRIRHSRDKLALLRAR